MKSISYIFVLGLIISLSSYSPSKANKQNFLHNKFEELAKDHEAVAILPFETKSDLINTKQSFKEEKVGPLEPLSQKRSDYLQTVLDNYLLKKEAQKGNETVSIQDVNETNAILAEHGVTQENIDDYSWEQLASILNVDAVISWEFLVDEPDPEQHEAFGTAGSLYGPADEAAYQVSLNDGKTGELLWSFGHTFYRPMGSDIDDLIARAMKRASNKFPY